MAQTILRLLIRRGSNAERAATVLAQGEIVATTDVNSCRLFVGDGVQPGGWPAASKFYFATDFTSVESLKYVQVSDLVFMLSTNTLYALTAFKEPDNILPDAFNPEAYMVLARR